MKTWLILLGGLIVWTIHFFGLYALAEIAPYPALVWALTAICAAADIVLLLHARGLATTEAFAAWRRSTAIGGAMLSLIAVCWQGLPALAT